VAERIEKGYQLFFRNLGVRSRRRVSSPSFRKSSKYHSFTLKQTGYKLLADNKIKIGKKTYRYHKSREIDGAIKTVTIKRDTLGDFYLYFSCIVDDNRTSRTMTGNIAGFDFGLKTFLTSSDGGSTESPKFFRQGLRKIQRANHQLSSKKRGSNNRRKARMNLARVHQKVANQRKDFHFKTAKALVDKYDFMFFEDLNLEGMKSRWGRKVSDLGFDSFKHKLIHMANKKGSTVGTIDRWFPSSKTCHVCGCINGHLQLRDRSWTCSCGAKHDRDHNAAINILMEGASSIGLGDVRRVLAPAVAT
jgi:putative transposase